MAMDRNGNIAIGFSVSSSSINPQIHFAGRLAADATLGVLRGEGTIIDGTGSQTCAEPEQTCEDWGDYTSMSIDPVDGCSFWYTNQYLEDYGVLNWKTQVGKLTAEGCAP
jgi:hypothetical protein